MHYVIINFIFTIIIISHSLVCSVELRELEAKLKAGYMNKERAAQLAEKDAIKKQEEVSTIIKVSYCICMILPRIKYDLERECIRTCL